MATDDEQRPADARGQRPDGAGPGRTAPDRGAPDRTAGRGRPDRRPQDRDRAQRSGPREGTGDRRQPGGGRAPQRRDQRPAAGAAGAPARRPAGPGGSAVRSAPSGQPDRRPRGAEPSARRDEPALPDDVTGHELDQDVRADLATLARDNAIAVSRHLVMAGRLLEEDPEAAYAHAAAAQRRAGRIGSVREAAGLVAYATGRHAEALRELRAARRLTGSSVHLPLLVDCERGLGRPERALELAASPEATSLDATGRVELGIVVAGARGDLGQHDAAVLLLADLMTSARPAGRRAAPPWWPRLLSAYADALAAAGRVAESRAWAERAELADPGAAARRAVEEEVVVYDLLEDADEPEGDADDGPPTTGGTAARTPDPA